MATKTLPPDGTAHFDTWNAWQDSKVLLREAWTTIMDVCEFSSDPDYELDINAMRRLMVKIDKAANQEDPRGVVTKPNES